MLTLIHVTHESIDHLGGIGTVLQGLLTSTPYRAKVGRSILVGPLPYPDRPVPDPKHRLGEHALQCLYSGPDSHDPHALGALLKPVEWAFGSKIVYGTRRFSAPGDEANTADAEVILLDLHNPDRARLDLTKWFLHEQHNIESDRYEHSWDYEEYTRLAGPAYHALCALLTLRTPVGAPAAVGQLSQLPAVVVAHEFMGVPTALRCWSDRARFRTLFHAHECSTARRITENLPGFDAAFYPAMNAAMAKGQSVGQVFGDQSDFGRHALVERSYVLDGIMAVGPETAEELRFLSPQMRSSRTRVVYNGLPARGVSAKQRADSRLLVNSWLINVLGYAPDYLLTHVTRPVPSKGLWRDLSLCTHLEPLLRARNQRAVYLLLTCGAPTRSFDDANAMARSYGWPRQHHRGYPDLVGPEVEIDATFKTFNQTAEAAAAGRPAITALLVNQFGFSRERLGLAAPEGLTTADLRRAADVELGMSTYEPFGIAQLEPLHAGAICVTSNVCGCMGLVKRAMGELGMQTCDLVLPADFVTPIPPGTPHPENLTAQARLKIEDDVCRELAQELAKRLPTTAAHGQRNLDLGQQLAQRMSWDHVVQTDFLPAIQDAVNRPLHSKY